MTCVLKKLVVIFFALTQLLGESEHRVSAAKPTSAKRRGPPAWAMAHGKKIIEGDIVMTENIAAIIEEGVTTQQNSRSAVRDKSYLWTSGVVPYVIDSTFDLYPHARTMINAAIGEVHKYSCVRFAQRTSEKYFVRFTRGQGCYSCVGQTSLSNGQPVSIGAGCETVGTILHELMHTLGFFHTSSRHDREAYVSVRTANIKPGFEDNFKKYSQGHVDRLQAPYDVTSLMHLPQKAWSRNGGNTIESRDGPNVVLGNNNALSPIDKAQLNRLYKCSENIYPSCYKSLGLENGQIPGRQLSSKSYQQYYEPHQARLHLTASYKGNGAWCAASNQHYEEWLQVDLGQTKRITSIATQGKLGMFQDAWVTDYKIKYSYSGVEFYELWPAPSRAFSANYDESSAKFIDLPVKFNARFVRIYPTHWHNAICLRVELYGCEV